MARARTYNDRTGARPRTRRGIAILFDAQLKSADESTDGMNRGDGAKRGLVCQCPGPESGAPTQTKRSGGDRSRPLPGQPGNSRVGGD